MAVLGGKPTTDPHALRHGSIADKVYGFIRVMREF